MIDYTKPVPTAVQRALMAGIRTDAVPAVPVLRAGETISLRTDGTARIVPAPVRWSGRFAKRS